MPLPFLCPACGTREQAPSEAAWARLRQEGRCQGCRARRTLERRPHLLPLFLGFWRRRGFPASASWLAAGTVAPEPGAARVRGGPADSAASPCH